MRCVRVGPFSVPFVSEVVNQFVIAVQIWPWLQQYFNDGSRSMRKLKSIKDNNYKRAKTKKLKQENKASTKKMKHIDKI